MLSNYNRFLHFLVDSEIVIKKEVLEAEIDIIDHTEVIPDSGLQNLKDTISELEHNCDASHANNVVSARNFEYSSRVVDYINYCKEMSLSDKNLKSIFKYMSRLIHVAKPTSEKDVFNILDDISLYIEHSGGKSVSDNRQFCLKIKHMAKASWKRYQLTYQDVLNYLKAKGKKMINIHYKTFVLLYCLFSLSCVEIFSLSKKSFNIDRIACHCVITLPNGHQIELKKKSHVEIINTICEKCKTDTIFAGINSTILQEEIQVSLSQVLKIANHCILTQFEQ